MYLSRSRKKCPSWARRDVIWSPEVRNWNGRADQNHATLLSAVSFGELQLLWLAPPCSHKARTRQDEFRKKSLDTFFLLLLAFDGRPQAPVGDGVDRVQRPGSIACHLFSRGVRQLHVIGPKWHCIKSVEVERHWVESPWVVGGDSRAPLTFLLPARVTRNLSW